jgi:Na+/H+ antiporter NhaB
MGHESLSEVIQSSSPDLKMHHFLVLCLYFLNFMQVYVFTKLWLCLNSSVQVSNILCLDVTSP